MPPKSTSNLFLPRSSPRLDDSWGAFLIGTSICVFLNVFSLILGYKYFRLFPTDIRFLRTLVSIVLPIDLLQTIINVHACYWHLVPNHSNLLSLISKNWSFSAFGPVSTAIVVLCQIFYARRVFYLGGPYRWVALLAAAGMVVTVGMDIAFTAKSATLSNLLEAAFRPITWMLMTICGATIFTDLLLTGSLVYMLWRSRRRGRNAAHSIITSIIAYTISAGVMFNIIGLLTFLFSVIQPGNLIFCAIIAFGVKVYVISMLTAIISRKDFADRLMKDEGMSMSMFKTSQSQSTSNDDQLGDQSGGRISLAFAPRRTEGSIIGAETTAASQAEPQDMLDSKPSRL